MAQDDCFSHEYGQKISQEFPQQTIAAHSFLLSSRTGAVMTGAGTGTPIGTPSPVITIPVVVHILYKDASQNISDEQVMSQIEVLNQAFRLQLADTGRIPAHFRPYASDARIEFCLAKVDPNGRATSGIIRKSTWVTQYGIDDRIKYSNMGGDDAWDSDRYLNIWVGALAGGIVAYASPLGGPKDRDGIAIRPGAFGKGGTAGAPYNLGRSLVHEVGHWLGLRHIWGDVSCGDDYVDDTPRQRSANRGCQTGIKYSCDNSGYGDMYMNFMDLSNDECLLMFTAGQVQRMRNAFAEGGPRHKLLFSNGCSGTPVAAPEEGQGEELPQLQLLGLYPNPVRQQLTIDIKNNTELLGSDVVIFNNSGQPVKTFRITQAKTIVYVNELRSGLYFINVNGGSKKYREKFLKM